METRDTGHHHGNTRHHHGNPGQRTCEPKLPHFTGSACSSLCDSRASRVRPLIQPPLLLLGFSAQSLRSVDLMPLIKLLVVMRERRREEVIISCFVSLPPSILFLLLPLLQTHKVHDLGQTSVTMVTGAVADTLWSTGTEEGSHVNKGLKGHHR
ncbi:hypothetical protein Bbelb_224470 [Branchiostoma belcheri]|nr:hypothetical protein Bbelb_224470 [Branchiostoma belcheri]